MTKSTASDNFLIAKPEFPDVGVTHRDAGPRALTERMIFRRSETSISPRSSTSLPTISAETTSRCCSAADIAVSISSAFLTRSRPSQIPRMTFSPTLRCELGHLVQSVFDGIGADTFGHLGEFGEIVGDLLRH